MKKLNRSTVRFSGIRACGMTLAAAILLTHAAAQEAKPAIDPESEKLHSLLKEIQGKLPDQAHAMADVAYHFSNLWFAGEAENWELAKFYANETKSHLGWAVRLKPVRSISGGGSLPLADLLAAIEESTLKELQESLKAKDKLRFENGYKAMMASCYSCHVAAEKPYLRLQVPARPPETMIDFRVPSTSQQDPSPVEKK